jgi:hypothetical protein
MIWSSSRASARVSLKAAHACNQAWTIVTWLMFGLFVVWAISIIFGIDPCDYADNYKICRDIVSNM